MNLYLLKTTKICVLISLIPKIKYPLINEKVSLYTIFNNDFFKRHLPVNEHG